MQEPPEGVKQHLAMFLDSHTFCAARLVSKSFRKALNIEHQTYFRARVKHISHFRARCDVPAMSTYKEVLDKIYLLFAMRDGFCSVISTSDELAELVFKTPILLDKLFRVKGGTRKVIDFLKIYPSYNQYVIHDPSISSLFLESEDIWVSSFVHLIYNNTEIYNSLLRSDHMMRTVALSARSECNDHLFLCDYLEEKYHASKEMTDAVRNLKTPRIEIELCNQERSDAIYSLLKSLKPVERESGLSQKSNIISVPSRFLPAF